MVRVALNLPLFIRKTLFYIQLESSDWKAFIAFLKYSSAMSYLEIGELGYWSRFYFFSSTRKMAYWEYTLPLRFRMSTF